MFDNGKYVKLHDSVRGLTIQGRFETVREAIEALQLNGTLFGQAEYWCCNDCDGGDGYYDELAIVKDGQIWPTTPPLPTEAEATSERTLRTRNITHVLANYLPGSGRPDQQKVVRKLGRRAQRRLSKAIVAEAMLELE